MAGKTGARVGGARVRLELGRYGGGEGKTGATVGARVRLELGWGGRG